MPTTPAAPTLEPTALARLEPLRPMPVHAVSGAMQEYQQGLQAILSSDDWQTFADRDGRERRFVKRPGWRKIATWFGLDLLVDESRMRLEYDERGEPVRAVVVGRAVAPNGRIAEDVGACSITERRFSKPEHDIVATATTRALNRATSNLVGMGELTAEEMTDDVEPMLPEWAQAATAELESSMELKLQAIVGPERAVVLARAISQRYGYVPTVVTGVVNALFSMLAQDAVADEVDTDANGASESQPQE